MNPVNTGILIAVTALVTLLLRFLPFIVFSDSRKVPDYVLYLGDVLPYAIMGMLIIYCLKNVTFVSVSKWLPDLICVAAVAGLHVWKRNTLLSILGGTLLYMALVQMVF